MRGKYARDAHFLGIGRSPGENVDNKPVVKLCAGHSQIEFLTKNKREKGIHQSLCINSKVLCKVFGCVQLDKYI